MYAPPTNSHLKEHKETYKYYKVYVLYGVKMTEENHFIREHGKEEMKKRFEEFLDIYAPGIITLQDGINDLMRKAMHYRISPFIFYIVMDSYSRFLWEKSIVELEDEGTDLATLYSEYMFERALETLEEQQEMMEFIKEGIEQLYNRKKGKYDLDVEVA